MKKTLIRSHTISFQEKVNLGFQQKSFDTPKEHLDFHLQNMKKSPELIRDVVVQVKKG